MSDSTREMVNRVAMTPAIPADLLARVFGQVTVDPKVEFAVRSFEYWLRSGASRSLQRRHMLDVLERTLTRHNAYRFVSLLAARGEAAEFFELAAPNVDRDRALRVLLESRGVDRDTIRFYSDWYGINPKAFADGFIFGVVESAASIVFDLAHLGELAWKVSQAQYRWLAHLAVDPRAAVADLWSQATVVIRAIEGIFSQLDPRAIPDRVVAVWRRWNEEFAGHLENLDGEAAGRQLGLLAGTLWQLLTGFAALARMLRIAGNGVLRYGSLALGSVRAGARQATLVVRDAAAVLVAWTAKVVDALPSVGLWFLHTLFPPRVVAQVVREGRAFVSTMKGSLLPVFGETYALAYSGATMRAPMKIVVVRHDRPVMMASLSDSLPPPAGAGTAGNLTPIEEALADAAAIDREVEAAFKGLDVADDAWDAALVAAAWMEQAAQRLKTVIRSTLTRVTLETFEELRRAGRFGGHNLGDRVHRKMASRLTAELTSAAPGAMVRTEITTTSLAKALASDPRAAGRLAPDWSTALSESVTSVVMNEPAAMKLLGVPAAARTEAEVAAALKKQFGWKQQNTTIGELRSDLIVADVDAAIVRNVDFTSSTKLDKFEQTWARMVDDLKGSFKGDPEEAKKAYEAMFAGGMPAEVADDLQALRTHALRETVVRRLALQRVLGPGWFVSSEEMLYEGLAKLWAAAK
jgi:hypothetical protein